MLLDESDELSITVLLSSGGVRHLNVLGRLLLVQRVLLQLKASIRILGALFGVRVDSRTEGGFLLLGIPVLIVLKTLEEGSFVVICLHKIVNLFLIY